MAIQVRQAKLADVWELLEMLLEFRNQQRELGVRTIAQNPGVLRGGTVIELGLTFNDPQWKYIVAEKDGLLVGFIVCHIERCGPTDEHEFCMRIHGDYLKEKSMANPRVLQKMWELLDTWAKSKGAEYYYGLIHPGNQPSIKVAKHVGFKHHMTQFLKMCSQDRGEE